MIIAAFGSSLLLFLYGMHGKTACPRPGIASRLSALCFALATQALALGVLQLDADGAYAELAAIALDASRLGAAAAFASLCVGFPADRRAPMPRAFMLALWVVASIAFASYRWLDAATLPALSTLALVAPIASLLIPAILIGLAALLLFLRSADPRRCDDRSRTAFLGMSGFVGALPSLLALLLGGPSGLVLQLFGNALFAILAHYACTAERAIGPAEALKALGFYLIWALGVGAPVGIAAAFLLAQPIASRGLGAPALVLLFLVALPLALGSKARFFSLLKGGRRYLARLESALAALDLESGRDSVLDGLETALSENMGFRGFSMLVEDDGILKTLRSSDGRKPQFERRDPAFEHIVNLGTNILSKRRAGYNHNFSLVRPRLMEVFEALNAEVLIVAREGREIIAILGLGSKLRGRIWDRYDFECVERIYGKLFVFAYYLRNAARAWIIQTVDREIALSDQVIRSIQQNVDHIEHAKVDAAFVTRSTRRLGGDFIDFVRVSEHRWFFVVGDVAGKGLNASMSMVILKSTIRGYLKSEKNFSRLVAKTNAFVKKNLPRGSFFAGVFGYFDFAAGHLYFINCGIPIMLLNTPGFASAIEVQGDGKVLGFAKDISPFLRTRRIALAPGSVLAIATDGILESENIRGERYGKERLQRALGEFRSYDASKTAELVVNTAYDFADGDVDDDVTLFVLKTREAGAKD